jgi:serine protease Do
VRAFPSRRRYGRLERPKKRWRERGASASREAGSVAEKAGVKAGDFIVSFDGKPTPLTEDLLKLLGKVKKGSTVPLAVLREEEEISLTAKF